MAVPLPDNKEGTCRVSTLPNRVKTNNTKTYKNQQKDV
jgi:hypothetical protein